MTREERENSLHCLKVMVEESNCEDCKLYGTTGTDHCERDCVRNAIEALEQEPKTGHWYNPLSESGYFCTNCESNSDFMYPYCPHCGARMGGAE